MTTGDPMKYVGNIVSNATTLGYMQVMDEGEDLFKRLVAWRGLKIRSISILGHAINIECYKGKKTYFITIDEDTVKVYNNKKECIDTVLIPKQYKYQPGTITTATSPWIITTDHTTAGTVKWRDGNTTLDPTWTTTSNSTAAGYKIDFE
jgi:hypothetical protein